MSMTSNEGADSVSESDCCPHHYHNNHQSSTNDITRDHESQSEHNLNDSSSDSSTVTNLNFKVKATNLTSDVNETTETQICPHSGQKINHKIHDSTKTQSTIPIVQSDASQPIARCPRARALEMDPSLAQASAESTNNLEARLKKSMGLTTSSESDSSDSNSMGPSQEQLSSQQGQQQAPNETLNTLAASYLPDRRSESTIPSVDGGNWLYPSERQFYKSATSKGHSLDPTDMNTVVNVHNQVNEQTWKQIMKYEERRYKAEPQSICTPDAVKLLYFHGRAEDLSWKAYIMTTFGAWHPPFDRHDWYIDRCGEKVRYIVDFYDGKGISESPYKREEGVPAGKHNLQQQSQQSQPAKTSIFIDARPEISSFSVGLDRFKEWMGW